MPNQIFDYASSGTLTANGVIYTVTGNKALAESIKLWLITPKGDLIRNPNRGCNVYEWLNTPLTDDYASQIRAQLYEGLMTDFTPPVSVISLVVEPDLTNRAWRIYGQFYSKTYNLSASLDISIST